MVSSVPTREQAELGISLQGRKRYMDPNDASCALCREMTRNNEDIRTEQSKVENDGEIGGGTMVAEKRI